MKIPAPFNRLGNGCLLLAACLSVPAFAASTPTTLGAPVTYTPGACVTYGDFISCSTQLLEGILGVNNTYALPVGPGQLQDNIVIGDNPGNNPVNDLVNSDTGVGIDNGYQTPTTHVKDQTLSFSTKDTAPGGTQDPTTAYTTGVNFTAEFVGDQQNFWDIRLTSLQNFLKNPDGSFNDMLIGFDHNQTGAGVNQDLLAWALVVVSDDQGLLPDRVFELTGPANPNNPYMPDPYGYKDPYSWTSTKTLNADPVEADVAAPFANTGDFVVSHGQLCTAGPTFTSKSTCEGAGGVWADANKGNGIDFVLFAPELNDAIFTAGYDVMHVRWDMRYLTNGAETAFLMPGKLITTVPEPETVALLGLGLMALAMTRRRRA